MKGFVGKRDKSIPLITVITVVKNGEKTLENTILSILSQDYPNIQYLIIDGLSTDGTHEIIRKYEHTVDYWISQTDKGIYDAMNTGVTFANGDWINFMNSGDVFAGESICSSIAEIVQKAPYSVVYGDCIAQNTLNDHEITIKASSLSRISRGMVFSHQSAFIKTSELRETPFNLSYKIAADYELILSLFKRNRNFYYVDRPLCKIAIGGLSYSNPMTIIEQMRVIHSHMPYAPGILCLIIPLISTLLSKLIDQKTLSLIRELKWRNS